MSQEESLLVTAPTGSPTTGSPKLVLLFRMRSILRPTVPVAMDMGAQPAQVGGARHLFCVFGLCRPTCFRIVAHAQIE